jgi:hypothetical protein
MGAKVKATQALQGKFSSEGLVALTQSEDMVSALAKALLNGTNGIDSAESYWRNRRPKGQEESDPVESAPAAEECVQWSLFGAEEHPVALPKARTAESVHAPRQLAFKF